MSEPAGHTQTVEVVPAHAEAGHAGGPDIMSVSAPLMILTWITFILMTVILYKIAWKPILRALEERESGIRKSLEEAEKARADAAEAEQRRQKAMEQAQANSQALLDQARVAAQETARTIETQARQDAKTLVEDARREIESATEKARAELRRETSELAVAVATKILGENMDATRNRALADRLLKEL